MSAFPRPSAKYDSVSGDQSVARVGCEIRHEIRTSAAATTVFGFLTNARQMTTWLAQDVGADPRPGGAFRASDLNGVWIEGVYFEVIPSRRVAFTWGGIEGLKTGESIVEFSLQADATGSVLRVRHLDLPESALHLHRVGWKNWGLPKLKAVAEGGGSRGTYLSDIADSREQLPRRTRVLGEY